MNREAQFNHEVAARIREARKAADLSQEDLGAKIGMSKVGFGHYERGTHLPSLWQMLELSRILGRPVTWFLGIVSKPDELTDDEQQLLSMYRRTRQAGMETYALGVMDALTKSLKEE